MAVTRSPNFGALAETYDRLRPVDENWWELFGLLVSEGDLAGRRVLDVGSGTGVLARALGARGARVWGVDPSDEMVAQARALERHGVAFARASAEALPFEDGWFERAVLRLVVHLLDRPRAFSELARVLVPDGRIVVATFQPDHFRGFWLNDLFPALEEIDGSRFPTPERLAADIRAAGFESVREHRLVQRGRLGRAEALERIRSRYISTLHLLDEREYTKGLARAERDLPEEIAYELHWLVAVGERGANP